MNIRTSFKGYNKNDVHKYINALNTQINDLRILIAQYKDDNFDIEEPFMFDDLTDENQRKNIEKVEIKEEPVVNEADDEEYISLIHENENLKKEILKLKEYFKEIEDKADKYDKLKDSIAQILTMAKESSDQILLKAKIKAEKINAISEDLNKALDDIALALTNAQKSLNSEDLE